MATRSLGLHWIRSVALLLVVAFSAACGVSAPANPTVCNGVSSEVGGCDPSRRHQFTGTTCEDLAKEWATVLDGAVMKVLDGPEAVDGQARSVLLRQALVLTTADLNIQLQALNLQAACDVPEFMAAAEPVFSGPLRARVGDSLFDGDPPMTYDDWLADVARVIRSIDDGE